ncbi:hypothetical protein WICPIJ_002635 [Wickerhamomyces pijperi]|uniref:Uncharacterized protein n=1 Tax=Wickerhamomyces pijperi TaxID=599730 RepID=A0A9P8QBB0_WICPI|nr:hypothetical protein WICPIJ_002635 [Wickerhamomyces pijperi]
MGTRQELGLLRTLIQLDVNGFLWLDSDDQFVGWDVGKDIVLVNWLVLDTHFDLTVVQGLTGSHDDRDTSPCVVIDLQRDGGVCDGLGVRIDGFVIQVGRLASVFGLTVLTNQDVVELERLDRFQQFDLLITNSFGIVGFWLVQG